MRRANGALKLVARAGEGQQFKDFLFWTFSGRPPGVGESDSEDFEPPRWRSTAFFTISKNGTGVASAFKATTNEDKVGIYGRALLRRGIVPLMVLGDDASTVDISAPVGSKVSAAGLERDGLRNCVLAINASFLNADTSETWAGVYTRRDVCRLR